MKIYISCTSNDLGIDIYVELEHKLISLNHSIFNSTNCKDKNNIIEDIQRLILDVDIFIVIITSDYTTSYLCNYELNIALQNDKTVLPIVAEEDVTLPLSLQNIAYIQAKDATDATNKVVSFLSKLNNAKDEDKKQVIEANTIKATEEDNRKEQIKVLKNALEGNQLTLICGAGVSIASGIPTWNQLLVAMLNRVFDSGEDNNEKINADELLREIPQSNLITGKYLRLLLKEDFEKKLKEQLYSDYSDDGLNTPLLDTISELARPKRSGKRLESIITFNFDDLIESKLTQDHINHCSIWKEGQIHDDIDELPIYHVHGYLPNKNDFDSPHLVFSEESYHSQFMDAFSWSNLTLLNAFSSHLCLFVGLSLSDPNLRRLLDISYRRNKKTKHYIIIKKSSGSKKTNEIANLLFEQDANSLGLNVIWCNDYDDIPTIIQSISE
jgi:NAD-dependent SIR2 family protein deacetylase